MANADSFLFNVSPHSICLYDTQPFHVCVKIGRRFREKVIETQPEDADRLRGPDRCGDSGSSFSSNHKSVLEHADACRVGETGYSSP